MHFEFTITIGDILMVASVVIWAIRIDRLLTKLLIEHDTLLLDYCGRSGIDITDLPTRIKR